MKPTVSIIIPVYNVGKYLEQCLDSVINQTLKDIEIICIDDGSTDSCPQVLDEYSLKDSRIKVVHKENSGYGKAMNIGLELAQGEYLGIVESDDYILPNMYEVLYKKAIENNLDLIKSDICYFNDILGYKLNYHYDILNHYYNKLLNKNIRESFFEFGINTTTGIYKRDFIKANSIRYNETLGASYQDTGFWFQVMSMCKRAMWIDEVFYMYRQDNPMSSVKSKGKMLALNEEYEFIENVLKSKKMDGELELCNYYRLKSDRYTFNRIDDSLKLEYANIIKEDYDKYKDNYYCNKDNGYLKWVEEICRNPKEVCEDIISNKKEIINTLDKYENIIVYGAGQRAQNVFIKLYNLGYYDKISNVCVTNDIGKDKFMNVEVKKINEIKNASNSLILVAVKKDTDAYKEITDTLNLYGFSNYLDTELINKYI